MATRLTIRTHPTTAPLHVRDVAMLAAVMPFSERDAMFIERHLPGTDWLGWGLKPYMYGMPVLKTAEDRAALQGRRWKKSRGR